MNPWKRLHDEFNALMQEEDRIVQQRGLREWCYGYVTDPESGEFGGWVASITTEHLNARFELLATEAGIALGLPPNTLPLSYWLHRLFLDLRANSSPLIRLSTDAGGIIDRLFQASAIYCARLERLSLEKSVMSEQEEGVAGQQGSPPVVRNN